MNPRILDHFLHYVVQRVGWVLNRMGGYFNGSKILVLGIAYKKDVDDQRESPALKVIQLLRERGAEVAYHDPHIPICRGHRHYPDIDMRSVKLDEKTLHGSELILLITDHSSLDYEFIEKHARCIVDTRNAFGRNGINSGKVYKA